MSVLKPTLDPTDRYMQLSYERKVSQQQREAITERQIVKCREQVTVKCLSPVCVSTAQFQPQSSGDTVEEGAERFQDPEGQDACCKRVSFMYDRETAPNKLPNQGLDNTTSCYANRDGKNLTRPCL